MCARSIDIGTCFLVSGAVKDGNEIFTIERDAFFAMPKEDFAEEMLTKAGASYISRDDVLYVVGEDALKFAMLTGNQRQYRRPMARGILNPGEEAAISMLEVLVEAVLGPAAAPGEIVAVTIPANPVDADTDTTYHRTVIERFLRRLGYEVKIINEALAIIYAENPRVESADGAVPFSGIGMSFGAGMVNVVAAWRAKKLLEFSVARGGDWIDEQVARVRELPVSKVTGMKERRLDLSRVDPKDPVLVALDIYYDELIRYVLERFKGELKITGATIDEPVDLVLAGGTAAPAGFVDKFRAALERVNLPIPIREVKLARDPLRTVAAGALVAAVAEERKRGGAGRPAAPQ